MNRKNPSTKRCESPQGPPDAFGHRTLASLALLWACYPIADTSYSNPQEFGTGQWLIEFRPGETRVQMEMRYERKSEKGTGHSSHGFSIDPALLSGLSRDQAMSGGTNVRFQLKRDAGTFNFEGWFKEGNGSGHFTFTPDHGFASQLTSQGFGSPTDEQLLSLAMSDTGLALISELKSQGYERFTLDQLVQLGNHGVNLEYVQGLKSYGYQLKTVDNLVQMRDHGVNLKFIQRAGRPGLQEPRTRRSGSGSRPWRHTGFHQRNGGRRVLSIFPR